MRFIANINKFKEWVSRTKKRLSKFFYALIISYASLFLALYFRAPLYVIAIILFATLIIPFAMAIMILTENPIYLTLKRSLWGKGVIYIIVTLYGAIAYVWASGEVNRIFIEAPTNFPWAISILTAIHFFKNIVLGLMGGYLLALLAYVNFWIFDILVLSYKNFKDLSKRVISGIVLVIGVGLTLGSAGSVTRDSDKIAAFIAVKADFNRYHSCKGEYFANIDGVIFLPEGNVLAARPIAFGGWRFEKVKCPN